MTSKAASLALALVCAAAGAAQAAPVRTDGPNPSTRTIARGLDHPWEMAFLPDGSSLVSERPGRLRFVSKNLQLSGRVVARFGVSGGEGGLLGVAVDPRFSRNRYVYVYRTTERGAAVVRYRFVRRRLRNKRTLFGGISVNRIHNGGRLKFGPGRRLYLTTGDSANPSTAQSSHSRNGKFLVLSRRKVLGRGGRPSIVSKGHRNPQGFAFSPRRKTLFGTEHGSTGCDEVNVIHRARNYGWPLIRCAASAPGLTRPLTFYPTSIAPSGATFMSQGGSSWSGDFLFGALRGQHIRRLTISNGAVVRNQAMFRGDFGRVRDVVEGPDGALYVLTDNGGDDRIIRIVPPRG
jgi:glucose/arabinose dehydrogenase